MAARVWPVDAVGGSPSYTGRSLRQTGVSPFVALGSTSRPLGGASGVRPGTPTNTVTTTSTTWTVTPFLGVIDGEAAAIAGTYAYSFDSNQTGSVTAAAGSARVDRLDVQISDPAESDGSSTPGIAVVYTAGTPGSGVAAAAPARSHPLVLINVPASGGGSPTVTWAASYYAAPGGIMPVPTLALLNAWTTAGAGQYAEVFADSTTANNGLYRFNGTSWVVRSLLDARTTTTASTSPAYRVGTASGTTSAGGDLTVTFPTPFTNSCWAVLLTDSNTAGGVGPVGLKIESKSTTGFVVRHYNTGSGSVLTSFATTLTYAAFGE